MRKGYTGYEKDSETGLEYAQARYYNPTHGRYTSIDPMTASATIKNPQTFNRYSYVLNSPYKFVDPLGLISQNTGACAGWCNNSDSHAFGSVGALTADKRVVARSPAETGPGSEGLVQMHFIHALKSVAIQKTAGNERYGLCPVALQCDIAVG